MDPFKEITTFVNVAQRGSLSAAARHEGLAPAMIGRRLDSLESRLGVKLIQRTTRRLTLTPEGIAFLEDCQRILRELEDAESAVSARGKQATGHLRITAPAGFGRAHVAPLVPRFVTEHPRLAVSLELSDRIADLIAEGFDCAIRFGEQADSQLVRVKIGESRRVVVAQSGYLKQHGTPMRPADLAPASLPHLRRRYGAAARLALRRQRRAGGRARVRPGLLQRRRRTARLDARRHGTRLALVVGSR